MNPHRGLPEDITEAYYRGLMHSVGYRRKDLDKPQIVVVNSWTDVNPGHQPLRELALKVDPVAEIQLTHKIIFHYTPIVKKQCLINQFNCRRL